MGMTSTATAPSPAFDWTCDGADEGENQLKTAVVYSDKTAANKAMEIHRWVVQQVDPNCPVMTTWWDIDWLKEQDLFEASCRQAAGADLLFVAVPAAAEFSHELRAWLAAVLRGNSTGDRALIAVLETDGGPPAGCTAVEEYLHEQADRAGVEYFPHRYALLSDDQADSQDLHEHATEAAPPRPDIAMQVDGVQHWGLNE